MEFSLNGTGFKDFTEFSESRESDKSLTPSLTFVAGAVIASCSLTQEVAG